MNWTHFLLWVAGIYIAYYLVIILLELAGGKNAGMLKPATEELNFSENISPHDVEHLPEPVQPQNAVTTARSGAQTKAAPEIIGSGGVLLKDVFSLARKEVIAYTSQVSF